jgi:hypothetical protein
MVISDGKIRPVTKIGVDSLEMLGYLSGVQTYRGPSEAHRFRGVFSFARYLPPVLLVSVSVRLLLGGARGLLSLRQKILTAGKFTLSLSRKSLI